MAELDYTPEVVAVGLVKGEAEALKNTVRDEYTARGYAYQTREPLT